MSRAFMNTRQLVLVGMGLVLATSVQAQVISRDSLRDELAQVIAVERLPVGKDSVWVALVRRGVQSPGLLARYNQENPYVLAWLLGNGAGVDHRTLLANLAPSADAQHVLLTALSGDSSFTWTLSEMLDRYRGASRTPVPTYDRNALIAFASHFLHLEADSTGKLRFSLCAKSSQLRDLPLPTSLALEAMIYSMVRPSMEQDLLPQTLAIARDLIQNTPRVSSQSQVDSMERILWERAMNSDDFRAVISKELDRRKAYLPFAIRAGT